MRSGSCLQLLLGSSLCAANKVSQKYSQSENEVFDTPKEYRQREYDTAPVIQSIRNRGGTLKLFPPWVPFLLRSQQVTRCHTSCGAAEIECRNAQGFYSFLFYQSREIRMLHNLSRREQREQRN